MEKFANAKSSSHKKFEGRLLCLCLTAACLSAPLNGLSPSLTLVASEFGYSTEERDIYLGQNTNDGKRLSNTRDVIFLFDRRFHVTICSCCFSFELSKIFVAFVYESCRCCELSHCLIFCSMFVNFYLVFVSLIRL